MKIRGQFCYLKNTSHRKKIFMTYKEGLKDLPVQMNPHHEENSDEKSDFLYAHSLDASANMGYLHWKYVSNWPKAVKIRIYGQLREINMANDDLAHGWAANLPDEYVGRRKNKRYGSQVLFGKHSCVWER